MLDGCQRILAYIEQTRSPLHHDPGRVLSYFALHNAIFHDLQRVHPKIGRFLE